MSISDDELKHALVDAGGVKPEVFTSALESSEAKELGVANVLIAKGALKDKEFGQLMAAYFKTPFVDLDETHVANETIRLIPEAFARTHNLIPVKDEKDEITIATDDPKDVVERSLLEKLLRKQVHYAYATPRDLKSHMYLFTSDPKQAIASLLDKHVSGSSGADTSVIELINMVIDYAYAAGASDIHIEPEEDHTMIRFRQDGILHDIVEIPIRLHDNMMTRLKVLARLATDERRTAQDGKVHHKTKWDEDVEIRLSLLPTTHAEKAVMRLMADRSQVFNLANLGLSPEDFGRASEAIQLPWGMILVTGPTGSGKSTSLYSMLKVLNKREVNITTIEDPVEYDMEGVNQIQVNEKTGLTFAKGLRSIVRQDPDIIMVGEIRDSETANIAVNAAMTGHLVLSTLHTNDAATAFPRLQDMDIEDFLIASTVNVVIAQRLVRKICNNCIQSVEQDKVREELLDKRPEIKKYFQEITGKKTMRGVRTYKGKGCHVCHQSGYHGRIGVFEVLSVSEQIREAVMHRKNADEIRDIAIKEGMTSMVYDGVRKAVNGMTTLEEVLRVTSE